MSDSNNNINEELFPEGTAEEILSEKSEDQLNIEWAGEHPWICLFSTGCFMVAYLVMSKSCCEFLYSKFISTLRKEFK